MPEPWTIETLPLFGPPLRVIIWNSALKSSRFGLARAMPCMNSGTNWAGSLTNFFMGFSSPWKGFDQAVALATWGAVGVRSIPSFTNFFIRSVLSVER